ncbi:hypothetical protein HZC07_03370 [Candidatus Micrarchaeota archaeon]|nr:hypothetical protein [Candidatus Micrarchaeota archaeon]
MLIDPDLAGKLAGLIALIAFLPYIRSILQNKTKPNKATWWIWSFVGLILGSSYYFSGARDTIWVPIAYFLGPLVVALLSLKYGEGGATRFDAVCMVIAAVSLIGWWFSGSAFLSMMLMFVADSIGTLPTIAKTWAKPETEDLLAWLLFLLDSIMNLFAVESWTVALGTYPIFMLCQSSLMVFLI